MGEFNTSKTVTNQNKLIFIISIILLCYSVLHFYRSDIWWAFNIVMPGLKGPFVSTFPPFWAWDLNPDFIMQNQMCIYFREGPENKIWGYGPLENFVTFPLIFLESYQNALKIWWILCYFFYFTTIFFWYKILILDKKLHSFSIAAIFIFLWLNFFPSNSGVALGAVEILEFFLLTLSLYYLSKEKDIKSGVFLGLAVMTKFLPFIFIPYFLLKRKYKLCISALVVIAIIAVLTEITLGWKNNLIISRLLLSFGEMENPLLYGTLAIPNMIQRLFGENFGYCIGCELLYPEAAKLTTKIVLVLIILFYGFIFLKNRKTKSSNYEISILLILMVSIIQHNELHFLIFLLVPFSFGFKYLMEIYRKTKEVRKKDLIILVSSFAIIAVVIPVSIFRKLFAYFSIEFLTFYQGFSIPCLGYLILLGWLTVKYIKKDNLNGIMDDFKYD